MTFQLASPGQRTLQRKKEKTETERGTEGNRDRQLDKETETDRETEKERGKGIYTNMEAAVFLWPNIGSDIALVL